MNIKKNITIKLSADDVRQIISDYLTNDGYTTKPEDIKFNIGEECRGYGMAEHYVTIFEGCSVNSKEK